LSDIVFELINIAIRKSIVAKCLRDSGVFYDYLTALLPVKNDEKSSKFIIINLSSYNYLLSFTLYETPCGWTEFT